MAGLLDLFLQDNSLLVQNGHSRRVAGQAGTENFVAYNTVGAAQTLHNQITAPLPYFGGAGGPIIDGEFGDSQATQGLFG